jgi:hypothetical protein
MAQHQLREPVQFGLVEARCVGVLQDVGAVLVRIGMRDHVADLEQLGGPHALPLGVRVAAVQLAQEVHGDPAHPLRLQRIGFELAGQYRHGRPAHVGVRPLAVEHVVQQAVAQRALRRPHLVDLQQREEGAQHAEPAPDHGAAVFLEPGQPHAVGAARREQRVVQPVEPFARDHAGGVAGTLQHVRHGADGS